ADDFTENVRAALLRGFELFENENARAFTNDEAVAILIERAGGVQGIVIALRERAHGGESADAHRGDAGFGAAADHDIGIATLDDAEGIADGVGACGAGGGGGG